MQNEAMIDINDATSKILTKYFSSINKTLIELEKNFEKTKTYLNKKNAPMTELTITSPKT